MTAALEVDDLRVAYPVRARPFRRRADLVAVDGVSLRIDPAEVLGVVGESGSGKSTIARAICRLVRATGTVRVCGQDMLTVGGKTLRARRRSVQMVFQDPNSSLDPAMSIADSVGEPLEVHFGLRGVERDLRVVELLEEVGLSGSHLRRFPNEFSGGQRQRIAIARALAVQPQLLICDEAVSALDVSTQNQIVELLDAQRREKGVASMFVAHDLAVVRHVAQHVAVMYLGRVVEHGPTERIFEHPQHPYTRALLAAAPVPNPKIQRTRTKIVLDGDIPNPMRPPAGCRFHPRCPEAVEICRQVDPPSTPVRGGGVAACHLAEVAATPVLLSKRSGVR